MRKVLIIGPAAALPAILAASMALSGGSHDPDDRGSASRSAPTSAADRTADGAPDRAAERAAARAAGATGGVRAPSRDTAGSSSGVVAASAAVAGAPSPAGGPAPAPAPAAPGPSADRPPGDHGRRFVCPEGGMDEVVALQAAVDAGHQPWRLVAEEVVTACTFDPDGGPVTVEPVGPRHYRVTYESTGEVKLVGVDQPLGPGTIWVVTSVSPGG